MPACDGATRWTGPKVGDGLLNAEGPRTVGGLGGLGGLPQQEPVEPTPEALARIVALIMALQKRMRGPEQEPRPVAMGIRG
jgi:hypothetical protein